MAFEVKCLTSLDLAEAMGEEPSISTLVRRGSALAHVGAQLEGEHRQARRKLSLGLDLGTLVQLFKPLPPRYFVAAAQAAKIDLIPSTRNGEKMLSSNSFSKKLTKTKYLWENKLQMIL